MPSKRKSENFKKKQKVQKKKQGPVDDSEDSEPIESEEYEEPYTDEEYDSEEEAAEKAARMEKKLKEAMEAGEVEATSSGKIPMFHRPQPGENLVVNHKAYDMRHLLNVTWPCLSFDIVLDQEGLNRVKYPLSCTIVAGTQADNPKKCEVVLKKVRHLCRTKYDRGDSDSSDDEEEEEDNQDDGDEDVEGPDDDDNDPVIYTKELPHMGSVLRVRSMRQYPGIVASWSEEGFVSAFDMRDLFLQLSDPKSWIEKAAKDPKSFAKPPPKDAFFQSTKEHHSCDGFALQWSSKVAGLLASGDAKGKINVWRADSQGTNFTATKLEGHKSSVEDLQWSPAQENVLASCSVDGTIRLWDIRDAKSPEKIKWQADVVDINVISWNEHVEARQFLASGSDSGVFKVWDLRMVKRQEVTPIFESDFHRESITSLEWCPLNSSLLAVASPNMAIFWDFSVEEDEEAAENGSPDDEKIPPQVMFIHQGVHDLKEIHWHPQLPGLAICTDLNGFQFFKPMNWRSLMK